MRSMRRSAPSSAGPRRSPSPALGDLAAKAIVSTGGGDVALLKPVIAECRALPGVVEPLPAALGHGDPLPGFLADAIALRRPGTGHRPSPGTGSPPGKAASDAFLAAEEAIEATVATSP